MDHITAFPRPAAPELPPHRLRSCQDCRTFPESQWMLSIGCFLFCTLRDDRTIRAIPFGRSALLHCAITFFCHSRCRSQNDKPAVPLSGEIEAFFLESDPSSASTALRMSVFQVRIFHGSSRNPGIICSIACSLSIFSYLLSQFAKICNDSVPSQLPFCTLTLEVKDIESCLLILYAVHNSVDHRDHHLTGRSDDAAA